MSTAEDQIKAVVASYNEGVRTADVDIFRKAFHPTATVAQYQERKGTVDVLTLDGFIDQIKGLHEKFGSAVEVSKAVDVNISDNIATARVPFSFQLGDKDLNGVNMFSLAMDNGEWRIMGKVYSL